MWQAGIQEGERGRRGLALRGLLLRLHIGA